MCGIAGILAAPGRDVAAVDVSLMASALTHRGPDDWGFMGWGGESGLRIDREPAFAIRDAQVGFAHRRLSIIDEGEGGWQPMATADGRFVLTYNGEIYNYLELRAELEGQGVGFQGQSDSEVLLQALATWGVERTLPKLTGMFAFALLDTLERTVTLARDPFGIKPLSYVQNRGGLTFASEIPALLTQQGVKRNVDPEALFDYLRFGLTDRGARTLFGAIRHLPPAHVAVVSLQEPQRVEPRAYWRAELKPVLDIGFEEAAEQLRALFFKNVRLHLRADVPVGAALSGGIDSSAVVAAMRELEGPALDLHTFTFVAPNTDVDEERWADMAANAAQASAHKVSMTGGDLMRDIDALIATQGEPFGSTSIYAQNRVFGLARENAIKVTLDGQGADEVLAGYVPFIAARMATMIKAGQWRRAYKLMRACGNGRGTLMRAMRFLLPTGVQGPARRLVGEELVPDWMNGDWFARHGVKPQAPQKPVGGDVLRQELLASLTDRVLPALLRYQDRNSMAHSVESRVPFLTTELVDFLYALPEGFLIGDDAQTKGIFRRAMQGSVPQAILDRRDKIGFATPQDAWMGEMDGWVREALSSPTVDRIGAIRSDVIRRRVEGIANVGGTEQMWRWVNLVRWAEVFEVELAS